MAHPKAWFYDTTSKMCILFLIVVFTNDVIAYDSTSLEDYSSESDEPRRINDHDNGLRYYQRYRNMDEATVKRALTLLARLKPPYVGMSGINTRSDIVTRGGFARPLGQPLRWG